MCAVLRMFDLLALCTWYEPMANRTIYKIHSSLLSDIWCIINLVKMYYKTSGLMNIVTHSLYCFEPSIGLKH